MRGLHDIPTRAFGLGLGIVIFDSLAAACIVFCTAIIGVKKWDLETRTRTLLIGMILLSLWCILNFIDVEVHQARAKVTYSYILVDCVYSIIRVVSDIFIIWGVSKLILSRVKLRYGSAHDAFRAAAILLWILGIYHVCMKFAVALSWLSLADVRVIQNLAKNRNAFEIAFQALQVILYVGTGTANLQFEAETDLFLLVSCFLLGVRSFCEIIIVGQLDRYPAKLQDILRARNVVYYLFSAAFAIVIAIELLDKKLPNALPSRETEAVDFVKRSVNRRIFRATAGGKFTAPKLADVLDQVGTEKFVNSDLRSLHADVRRNSRVSQSINDFCKAEVKRLRKSFKDWEPIHMWDGKTVEVATVGSTADRGVSGTHLPPPKGTKGAKRGFPEATIAKLGLDSQSDKTKPRK